ncbi:MAG: hypothetical protein JWL62_249 [Hyphomicrobiales bacterium]|nr:hypothetical protein [Hyphomicrobiales bacterium]
MSNMKKSIYRPDIDGLRAIAITLVLLFHLNVGFTKGGYVGVDVFFVISGFLITGLVVKEAGASRFSLGHFYERRVRRLFPALFAVFAASSVAAYFVLFPPELEAYGRSLISAIAFVANLFFWNGAGYFADGSEVLPLHHTWSLAVEEQFYLFFPLMLLPLLRLSPRALKPSLWVGAMFSFALSVYFMRTDPESAFYLLPARAWELLTGALLAVGAVPDISTRRLRDGAAALGLAAILIAGGAFNKNVPFPGWSALVPCIGAALIIHSGRDGDTLVARLLARRGMVLVGLASYSIYVWHMPIIVFFKMDFGRYLSNWDRVLLAAVSLAVGFLSWRYIERPFRYGGLLTSRRSLFGAAAGAMVAGVAVASLFVVGHGFEGRYPENVRKMAAYRYDQPVGQADGGCFISRARSDAPRVDPRCLEPMAGKKNYLLMGDSHADHLWLGFEGTLPGIHLMEATASGCKPVLRDEGAPRCRAVMNYILNTYLPSTKVDGIIIGGLWTASDLRDLVPTVRYLHKFSDVVIVMGPVPVYDDKLPRLLARSVAAKDPSLVIAGRDPGRAALDKAFAKGLAGEPATYVSIIDALCDARDCTTLDENGDPLQFDYGHFTASGARLLARRLVAAKTPGLSAAP